MQKGNYSVYVHIFPNNKRYVGMTSQKPRYRWNNGKGYKRHPKVYSAILKYGWENVKHEIIKTNLTKKQAEKLEINLIKLFQSNNIEFGYNDDSGGITHKKFSKEHIKKMTHKMSDENKLKLSKRMKNNKYNCGTQRNQEYIKKISIKIECIETKEIFPSIIEASRTKKINKSNLYYTVKGKRKTAGGYHWKEVE